MIGVLAWGERVPENEDEDDEGKDKPAHDRVEPIFADAETGESSDEDEDESRKPDGGGFDRIQKDAGPGMPLQTYLPKREGLAAKFSPSLTPVHGFCPSCGVIRERP